jgi:hypothetical protein
MSYRKGEAPFDRWSLVHAGSGMVLGLLRLDWLLVLTLLLLYEAFEGFLRRVKTEDGGLFEYESWPNIAIDIAAGMVGYGAMTWLLSR